MSQVFEREGDLFDAPEGSALIHACNCQGSWGKGVAKIFREKYPAAYKIYRSHCQQYLSEPQTSASPEETPRTLKLPEGTTLIIPPQKTDYDPGYRPSNSSTGRGHGHGKSSIAFSKPAGKKHWIICLFTSWHYGPKNKSSPDVILRNTILALGDLKKKMDNNDRKRDDMDDKEGFEFWSCRINAGLFGVPWEDTRAALEESGLKITVMSPAEE